MTELGTDVLTAENLHLWRGGRPLFAALDLEARPGRLVHVQGANGAGKTSLLRILCGLASPDEGQVLWRGRRIEHARGEFHQSLAWLGHRDGLKQDLSALENLRFGCGLQRRPDPHQQRAALEQAGVGAAADLPVRFLSAGQRRRVALARVAASGAAVWLLDEPFTNLDAEGTRFAACCALEHLGRGGLLVMAAHRLAPELRDARLTTVALS